MKEFPLAFPDIGRDLLDDDEIFINKAKTAVSRLVKHLTGAPDGSDPGTLWEAVFSGRTEIALYTASGPINPIASIHVAAVDGITLDLPATGPVVDWLFVVVNETLILGANGNAINGVVANYTITGTATGDARLASVVRIAADDAWGAVMLAGDAELARIAELRAGVIPSDDVQLVSGADTINAEARIVIASSTAYTLLCPAIASVTKRRVIPLLLLDGGPGIQLGLNGATTINGVAGSYTVTQSAIGGEPRLAMLILEPAGDHFVVPIATRTELDEVEGDLFDLSEVVDEILAGKVATQIVSATTAITGGAVRIAGLAAPITITAPDLGTGGPFFIPVYLDDTTNHAITWSSPGQSINGGGSTLVLPGSSDGERRLWIALGLAGAWHITTVAQYSDIATLSSTLGTLIGRTLTAGAGLTGGGDLSADRTFAVGAGTGITVNADDVAIATGGVGFTQLAAGPKTGIDPAGQRAVSGNITVDSDDNILLVTANADITLPAAGSSQGRVLTIKKGTATALTVNLVRAGSEKIENVAATYAVASFNSALYAALSVWSDGTDWWVL